ncbi:hypothetical protein WA158_002483 [Blastocystis sp. Blastoise]
MDRSTSSSHRPTPSMQSSLVNSSKVVPRGGGTSNDRAILRQTQVRGNTYTKPVPFKRQEQYNRQTVTSSKDQAQTTEQESVSQDISIDQEAIKQLLEDQDRLNEEIINLKKDNKSKEDDIRTLKQSISEYVLIKNDYTNIKNSFISVQTEKKKLEADYAIVKQQLDTQNTNTSSKDGTIKQQANKIEELTAALTNDQEYYQKSEEDYKKTIDTYLTERNDLQNQLNIANEKILSLEKDIANSEQSVKMKIDSLELQVTTLTTDINRITMQAQEASGTVEQLKVEIQRLNVLIEDKDKSIAEKDEEISHIPELKQQLEEYKTKSNDLEQQLQATQTSKSTVEMEKSQKENEMQGYADLQSELNQLKELSSNNETIINTLKQQLEEKEQKYNEIKQSLDSLTSDYNTTKKLNETNNLLKTIYDKNKERKIQMIEEKQNIKDQISSSSSNTNGNTSSTTATNDNNDNDNNNNNNNEDEEIILEEGEDGLIIMEDPEEDASIPAGNGESTSVPTSAVTSIPLEESDYEVLENLPNIDSDNNEWISDTNKVIYNQMVEFRKEEIKLRSEYNKKIRELKAVQKEKESIATLKDTYEKQIQEKTASIDTLNSNLVVLQEQYDKAKSLGDYETIIELNETIHKLEVQIEKDKLDISSFEEQIKAINLKAIKDPENYNKKMFLLDNCVPYHDYMTHAVLEKAKDATRQSYEDEIRQYAGDSASLSLYDDLLMDNESNLMMEEGTFKDLAKKVVDYENEVVYYENVDTLLDDNENERNVLKYIIKSIKSKINGVNNSLSFQKCHILSTHCLFEIVHCNSLLDTITEMFDSGYKADMVTGGPEKLKEAEKYITGLFEFFKTTNNKLRIEANIYRQKTLDYYLNDREYLIPQYTIDDELFESTNTLLRENSKNDISSVYKAKYNNMIVASKVIKDIQMNDNNKQAINRYITFHSICESPYIEKFYGCRLGKQFTICTEIYTTSLKEVLEFIYKGDSFAFTFIRKMRTICQMANILLYLSSLSPSVVHGRVHPDNIYVSESLNIVLSDPFLDTLLYDLHVNNSRHYNSIYIAPEVVNGDIPTIQSDIYSFGIIMIDILTGAITNERLTTGFTKQDWLRIADKVKIHPRLLTAINKCIEVDPYSRYDINSLCELLNKILSYESSKDDITSSTLFVRGNQGGLVKTV